MNENNVISFFNANNGKTYTNDKGKKIKLDLTSLDVFKEKMSTKEKRRKTFDSLWGAGINLFGKYNDFEKKYGDAASTQTTAGTKLDLQKLMKIDSTIKKTTSPDQAINRFTDTNLNKKFVWIFFSDGNWRQRANSVNNKVGESIGKWYFTDNEKNYQIKSETTNEVWNSNDGKWVKPNSPSKTWKEVTFTLEDVLAGKAVLKKGDKGPAVEELQKLMIQMNLSKVSKSGQPDGKFGKLTELSIKQFQGEMAHGEQDGKVGKKTLNRMYYVYNYDPDKEVDDEQPQAPATSDKYSPQGVPDDAYNTQTPPDDTQNVTTDTKQPELVLPNAEPTTQPKQKLVLTPKVVQEDIKKIVSENLKSLVK